MMKPILSILIATLLLSCSEEIPLDIATSTQVVANCLLYPDSTQELTLVYSKSLSDGGIYYDAVESATVSLYQGNSLIGLFTKKGSRTWEIKHYPEAGASYKLVIAVPNKDTLWANTTMPYKPVVLKHSATQYKKRFTQLTQKYNQWVFGFNANYDSVWETPFVIPEIKSTDRLSEIIATDHPNADEFNQSGNLDNLIGTEASLPAYQFYIRLLAGITHADFNIESDFGIYCFVVFRNASDEYDQYLKTSLQKMLQYADEDDPLQWFDENTVYSNIENGVGIFGAYADQVICYGNLEFIEQ